ncbi:MAG: hypothetical protein ISS71_00120 [Phycisphaerae bacterium]|nr:hypothetical protein [Phycisphaerae bacterium]
MKESNKHIFGAANNKHSAGLKGEVFTSSYAIVIAAAVIAAVMLALALRQRFRHNNKPPNAEEE